MSLSLTLNNAKMGLQTTGIQADLISRNIANADTHGYSRKIGQQVTSPSGGVQVVRIDRQVDELLNRLTRFNTSKLSSELTVADGLKSYTDYLGQPADEMSPVASLADLNSALIILATAPGDSATQISVISAAQDMAGHLNQLGGTLNNLANEVEMNIRYDVNDLNSALKELSKLNLSIATGNPDTVASTDFGDRLDRVLDQISGFMDVTVTRDKNGMVNLSTAGGTELVKGSHVNPVSYDPGAGRLMAGDVDITPNGESRGFSGGSLGGLFDLKTNHIPTFQDQLDTIAGSMIETFERVAPLGVAGMGLFTDGGQPFDPANIKGMASRIRVNQEVDPYAGGDASILQQGTDPTRPAGDSSVIDAMLKSLTEQSQVTTPSLGVGSIQTLMVSMVSSQQKTRAQFEQDATSTLTAANTISATRENMRGVNIDDELQHLIMIEKNYAANSKVLTAVSEMLDALINAG